MQVIEEDGGKLNAFAREPRMVVVEKEESDQRTNANQLLWVSGVILVAALVAVAAAIS